MILTSDFTNNITINVDRDFKTDRNIALNWFETSDGNIHATDYGVSADKYQCIISTYGTETYINNIVIGLEMTRTKRYCYLSNFADNEKIFGENIDYSALFLSSLFVGYNKRKKTSFNGFGLDIGLKLYRPLFVDYGTFNFSAISAISYDYEGDKEIVINNIDTYTGEDYSYDKNADKGSIKYKMNLNSTQFIQLLNYQRTQRGNPFTLNSLPGITYPFGPSSIGPWSVKLISVDSERFGLNRFLVTVELREIK